MAMRRTRGLSLTDVVVVLGVLALLLGMAGRSLRGANEIWNRVMCARNLDRIYKGMYLYSTSDKRGNFPRTTWVVDAPPTQYTGVGAASAFGPGGPATNDVTAALFLVLREQGMASSGFICPSTTYKAWDFGGKTALQCSNFPGNENLAYGVANPYPGRTANDGGFKWSNALYPQFVMAGDMNPGGAVLPTLAMDSPAELMRQGNSRNHGGDGQNVLLGDGHIEFVRTPFCGVKRDCIYSTAELDTIPNGPTIAGPPGWYGDTVLLPVATVDPGYGSGNRQVWYVAGGVAVAGGLIGIALWLLLKKRKPAAVAQGGAYPPPPPGL